MYKYVKYKITKRIKNKETKHNKIYKNVTNTKW